MALKPASPWRHLVGRDARCSTGLDPMLRHINTYEQQRDGGLSPFIFEDLFIYFHKITRRIRHPYHRYFGKNHGAKIHHI